MTRPSFRNTSRGARSGGDAGGGAVWGSPFSQAQILHLMKTEFARSRRHELPLSAVVVQVDRLRSLVDIHGPRLRGAVKDALVRLVVESTRGCDLLGVLNDDRFVLLLPHTAEDQAAAVAERIRARFRELDISVGGTQLALTLSCGIAGNADRETLFFDTVLSQAEVALEWARDGGGNRIAVFTRERFAAEEEPIPPADAGSEASS